MSGFNIELLNGVSSVGGYGQNRMSEMQQSRGENKADAASQGAAKGQTFADMLSDKLSESNELIKEANTAAEELVAGRNKDIHGAMISLEKADISFRMLMQVRNKMIDAYREIMRMQV